MENKTLVAYFSASGVTAKAASSLAAAIGADLYEIKPAVPYTNKDLNWQDKRSRSSMEMNESSSRPELAERNVNLAAYNRIFLGFPIWWYTAPRIIQTYPLRCGEDPPVFRTLDSLAEDPLHQLLGRNGGDAMKMNAVFQ